MHKTSESLSMEGVTTHSKLVSLFLLFLLFIFIFGLPSLEKFQAGGLTVEHSTVKGEGEGNQLPGITVCPYHAKPRTPWRNATAAMDKPQEILAIECNMSTGRDMLACIEEKTYSNIEELVYKLLDGKNPDTTDFTWVSHYLGGVRGYCHTLVYPHPIGTNHYKEAFMMILNPNISYNIYLHDPVFFWPTTNPSAIPNAKINIDEGSQGEGIQLIFLEVTKHKKLNTPSSPCIFTFAECVTTSLANIFGNEYLSTNSTTKDILRVELFLTELVFATSSELAEITGCQKPCEFMEYKLVGGKPDTIEEDHGFLLTFTSTDMSVLTEVRIQRSLHTRIQNENTQQKSKAFFSWSIFW